VEAVIMMTWSCGDSNPGLAQHTIKIFFIHSLLKYFSYANRHLRNPMDNGVATTLQHICEICYLYGHPLFTQFPFLFAVAR